MTKRGGILIGSSICLVLVIGAAYLMKVAFPSREGGSPQPTVVRTLMDPDDSRLAWHKYNFGIDRWTVQTIPGVTVAPGDTVWFRTDGSGAHRGYIGDMVPDGSKRLDYVDPVGVIGMKAKDFFVYINHPGKVPFPNENAVALIGAFGTLEEDPMEVYTIKGSEPFLIGYNLKIIVPEGGGGGIHLRMNIPYEGGGWWNATFPWRVNYAILRK